MKIGVTPFEGLVTVTTPIRHDERGEFFRVFCETDWSGILGPRKVAQINLSTTKLIGSVRGMHYQKKPSAEMKIIRCISGRVFDVAIDLRRGSKTFLHWHGVELSAHSGLAYVIPEGFAHGFQVLEADSKLLYMHTAMYDPASEAAVRFNDPRIDIKWPLAISVVSERDTQHQLLGNTFEGVEV
jgi:dTDP-4-dehydrorhamnose 3,5-epimerase